MTFLEKRTFKGRDTREIIIDYQDEYEVILQEWPRRSSENQGGDEVVTKKEAEEHK